MSADHLDRVGPMAMSVLPKRSERAAAAQKRGIYGIIIYGVVVVVVVYAHI